MKVTCRSTGYVAGRVILAALAGTVAFSGAAEGQSLSQRVRSGFESAGEAYSMTEVRGRCLPPFGLETGNTVRRTTCMVVAVRLLGISGGGRMYAAQYRRREVDDSSRHADLMDWDELMILRADQRPIPSYRGGTCGPSGMSNSYVM